MALLTLNGISCDAVISAQGVSELAREIGQRGETANGSTYVTRSRTMQGIEFRTRPLALATSRVWQELLRGGGEVWSFDRAGSLYGSKGRAPSQITGTVDQSIDQAKYGTGSLKLDPSSSVKYGNGVDSPVRNSFLGFTGWTVCVWRYVSSWIHYTFRSDGAKWVDGARNDAASTTWFTLSSTELVLSTDSGTTAYFDDLWIFPGVMLDTWPPQIHAAGVGLGQSPELTARGDLVTSRVGSGNSSRMLGEAQQGDLIATGGGTVAVALDVSLRQT